MTLLQLLLAILVIWLIVQVVNSLPALRPGGNPIVWIVVLILVILLFTTYGGFPLRLR